MCHLLVYEYEEYDDDLLYPDFVNEIHKFIWDELCAKIDSNYKYVKSDVGKN